MISLHPPTVQFRHDERPQTEIATRASQMISAYDNAIICDDCNAADPKAKGAVGNYVLDKIYAADKVQYNALLKSIGEPERVG